jgi:hypothetical protein
MAYPIKMLKDEDGQSFVPLTSLDAVIGEKNLQYIFDAKQIDVGHFKIEYKDLEMDKLVNSIIVIRWPQITSVVKPSFLQLNEQEKVALYNGTGTEYLSLEDASNTINMFAYDGSKWVLTSGAGSGSGHIITDDEGNTLEQQKILNFVGFNVENDAANRATKIVNPTPINNLTTSQSGQGSLDAYQGYVLSGRTIPTGGTKGQVLAKTNNNDYQVEWINKDDENVIMGDGSIKEIIELTYDEYVALEEAGQLKDTTEYHISDMNEQGGTYISEVEIQNMIKDNDTKLNISGGTLTGPLKLASAQFVSDGAHGMDASNSDIINCSSFWFNDTCNNSQEGFLFKRSGSEANYDCLQALDNYLYWIPDIYNNTTKYKLITTYDTKDIYPVGSVYITSTKSAPTHLGGTWQLIKKDFSYKYTNEVDAEAGMFVPNKDVVSSYDLRFSRQGDCFKIRLYIVLAVDVADATVTLGTFNMNALGLSGLKFAMFGVPIMCDGGNGILNAYFNTNGVLECRDILNKYAETVMAAGSAGYLSLSISCADDEKLDNACDKFYWKRTA